LFEKWPLQFITEENIENIQRTVDKTGFQNKRMIWSSSFLYWSKQSNTAKLNIRDNNLLASKVDSFFRTEFAADSKKNGWHNSGARVLFEGGITGNLSSVRTVLKRKKWGNWGAGTITMFEKWPLQFITEENIENIQRTVDIRGLQKKRMIWSSSFLY